MLARRAFFEAAFAAITLYSARPVFASPHLPLQDIPQHMAAIAVLKRYAFEPDLAAYVELTLSRTQYLLVYALGVPLSALIGVERATQFLVALTVVALPYALRYALRRTGGDERLASLAWPFAWNPQMMYGFLNFLIGLPLALWALGLFAERHRRLDGRRRALLAVLALATFYAHLIAFGLLGLGALLMLDTEGAFASTTARLREAGPPFGERAASAARALGGALRERLSRWGRELLFFAPCSVAVAVWLARSPIWEASIRAGGIGTQGAPSPTWPERAQLAAELRTTLLNIQGGSDELALIAWALAILAILAVARIQVRAGRLSRPSARLAWLPFACAALYVTTPASYGWIWPIHTRFAVAAALLLPLALPRLRGACVAHGVVAAMAFVTVRIADDQAASFRRWDREELRDLDAALEAARPGRRLVALVPATQSAAVAGNVPLLHAAAYYQVRGGDVATFSFADFPQSPFRYREGGPRPPRLRPRWEWQASLREADPQMSYYDYVLVRIGYQDEPARMPDRYTKVYAGEAWSLYERRR